MNLRNHQEIYETNHKAKPDLRKIKVNSAALVPGILMVFSALRADFIG